MLPAEFSIYKNKCSKNIHLETSEPSETVLTPPVPTDVRSDDQNDNKLVDYLDDGDWCTLQSSNIQHVESYQR